MAASGKVLASQKDKTPAAGIRFNMIFAG